MLTSVYEVHHLVNVLLFQSSCCQGWCAQTNSTWIQCTFIAWNCIINSEVLTQEPNSDTGCLKCEPTIIFKYTVLIDYKQKWNLPIRLFLNASSPQ